MHLAKVAERELDSAVDMQTVEIMHTMLPPVLTDGGRSLSHDIKTRSFLQLKKRAASTASTPCQR